MAIVITASAVSMSAYANDINESTTNNESTTQNETTTDPNLPPVPDTTLPDGQEATTDPNGEGEDVENGDDNVPQETEEELNNKEQELDSKLDETENQMQGLSQSDAEYMQLLDKKIGYINAQLMIYDNQVMASRGNVGALQMEIDPLIQEITFLEGEYNLSKSEYDYLNGLFRDTYDKYCARLRAFYVTGETSVLSVLLSSKDISQFLVRLEIISVMTKKDGDFMQEVDRQMEILVEKQNGLMEKKTELDTKTQELLAKMDELKANEDNIIAKQEKITQKKLELAQSRAQFPSQNDDGASLFYNSNEILNLTYPVPNQHHLSLGYGHYSDGRPHRALDFPLSIGTSVVAAQKGIVLKAVDLGNRSYGRYVMIYHGTDIMGRQIVTLYAHNSELLVTPGQTVAKGQPIAKGGSTGNSTGPHCHFELRVDNKLVNPAYFLS